MLGLLYSAEEDRRYGHPVPLPLRLLHAAQGWGWASSASTVGGFSASVPVQCSMYGARADVSRQDDAGPLTPDPDSTS